MDARSKSTKRQPSYVHYNVKERRYLHKTLLKPREETAAASLSTTVSLATMRVHKDSLRKPPLNRARQTSFLQEFVNVTKNE